MPRSNETVSGSLIDAMLGEASWLLSHAQALEDYDRRQEAAIEFIRAGECEEQVACLLEADDQNLEAAIHRVSAASCFEKVGQFSRAVTLLHAAMSAKLPAEFRGRIEKHLAVALVGARRDLAKSGRRRVRKQSPALN